MNPWPNVKLPDGTEVYHTVESCRCCQRAHLPEDRAFSPQRWAEYADAVLPILQSVAGERVTDVLVRLQLEGRVEYAQVDIEVAGL